ncbi:MAG: hypothetical protein ACXAC2_20350 [Candidatus Kariarchaeaceae archaeon]|jgi:hypothetical protein
MKIKEFLHYVWIAQEIAGMVFASMGLLVLFNFIQIEDSSEFIELTATLVFIIIIINIVSFVGIVIFDYEFFITKTDEIKYVDDVEFIGVLFVFGLLFYFIMLIPIVIWFISFRIVEILEEVIKRLLGFSKLHYQEIGIVLLVVGMLFIVIWFYERITTVFEITIIKRRKGENN